MLLNMCFLGKKHIALIFAFTALLAGLSNKQAIAAANNPAITIKVGVNYDYLLWNVTANLSE